MSSDTSRVGTRSSESALLCTICYGLPILSHPPCPEEERKILPCTHVFHRECIERWQERKNSCPDCDLYKSDDPNYINNSTLVHDSVLASRRSRMITSSAPPTPASAKVVNSLETINNLIETINNQRRAVPALEKERP